jgi:fructose-1,6-bisphosphatase II
MWKPGPAFYMNKLVVARAAAAAIKPKHLNAPVSEVLAVIAEAKEKKLAELTVFVLDKPRHARLIDDLRKAGVRVLLRTDGDVAGALMAARPESGVDALMGIGGTPEGVIAACAVRALGGAMLGQLAPQRADEIDAVKNAGLDTEQVLTETDLVASDDVFFAATGITDGVLLPGVHYGPDGVTTASLVMRGKTGTVRTVLAEHRAAKLRALSAVAY